MAERKKPNIQPFNQIPQHGTNLRSGKPTPRRSEGWEARSAQSAYDKRVKIRQFSLNRIADKYPKFGSRSLPAHAKKAEIIHTVENNKASATAGETGSGKSTQISQYLYEAGYRVYHIVPRKNIADNLHSRISYEMSAHIDNADEVVGLIHGDYTQVHSNNKITIMTANTFLIMEKEIREKHGDEKVAVICDETHESDLYVDMGVGVAAWAASQQENWRVHAVSATQNQEAIDRAFAKLNKKGSTPTVHIEGRPFDVSIDECPDKFAHELYADIGEDHKVSMIFTSGKAEIQHIIQQTQMELDIRKPGSSAEVEFRVLHGDLNRTERSHTVNDPVPEGKRVVIVSTNAGTSGITVPGNTLVISDGTVNRSELDRDTASGLVRRYVSRDGLIQQFGRASRDVGGGAAYLVRPTVIHEDSMRARGVEFEESMPYVPMDERERFSKPEIYDSLLGQVALTEAASGRPFYVINEFLPNPVEGSGIISAQDSLYRMGAMRASTEAEVASNGELYTITRIGKKMSAFAIRPELSRGLVEASQPGKTMNHMARVACIAAALDAGGLQDFSKDADTRWENLLRATTDNDWIAQLDLMQSLPGLGDKIVDEDFVKEHDLSPRRVERAMDVASKIFKAFDIISPEIINNIRSNLVEEHEAISDLMAGMGDYVYERVGKKYKRTMYSNIHGNAGSTKRYVSDRSVTSQNAHKLVAGWPRYFVQSKSGKKQDIVELIVPASQSEVERYARLHDTFEKKTSGKVRINNGVAQQEYLPMFGTLQIGESEYGAPHTTMSLEVQDAVVEHVLSNPGAAQKELRHVASVLESFVKSIPAEYLENYKSQDSGPFLTNSDINLEIRRLAKEHIYPHEVEQGLGAFIRKNSYHISKYFDDEAYAHLLELSPKEVTLSDGSLARVHYNSPHTPYVTLRGNDAKYSDVLKSSDMMLPDGRTIFVKTQDSVGQPVFLNVSHI